MCTSSIDIRIKAVDYKLHNCAPNERARLENLEDLYEEYHHEN